MSTKSIITSVFPLPRTISRAAAIAQLHDHHAMIEVNPLVLRHTETSPPPGASKDEIEYGTWYEITDRINYLPGIKGEVAYKACFYNLPDGLQVHTFAPAGLDMRSKYAIGGNLPGEPKEPIELGLNVPRDQLYLKETVVMRCSILLAGFVKKNLKKSHAVVAEKIIARAGRVPITPIINNGIDLSNVDDVLVRQRVESSAFDNQLLQQTRDRSDVVPAEHDPHQNHPPHCQCEGTSHLLSCSFFHPDDLLSVRLHTQTRGTSPRALAVVQQDSDEDTDISEDAMPTDFAADSASQQGSWTPELHGSVRADQCLCTSAIHDRDCPGYPGLRQPGARPRLSVSTAAASRETSRTMAPTLSTHTRAVSTPILGNVDTSMHGHLHNDAPVQYSPVSPLEAPVISHNFSHSSPVLDHFYDGQPSFVEEPVSPRNFSRLLSTP